MRIADSPALRRWYATLTARTYAVLREIKAIDDRPEAERDQVARQLLLAEYLDARREWTAFEHACERMTPGGPQPDN